MSFSQLHTSGFTKTRFGCDQLWWCSNETGRDEDEDEDEDVCGSANEKLWKLGFISVLSSTVNAFFFFFRERGIG